MSNRLNSTQWRKIAVFVDRNRGAIAQFKTHKQLDDFMRGEVDESLFKNFKPLLGEKQRWCDVGDVHQICTDKGIKCPCPPLKLLSPTME